MNAAIAARCIGVSPRMSRCFLRTTAGSAGRIVKRMETRLASPSYRRPPKAVAEQRGAPRDLHPYALQTAELAVVLGSDTQLGLTDAEARARLASEGPNAIPEEPPIAPMMLLLRQFADAMVLLLIAAAVVSLAIGETLDAGIIFAIVVLNAGFGAIQDGRAQAAARSVRALLVPHAIAIRDGTARELSAAELVRGDLLVITSGDRVAADGRVVDSSGLEIDESVMTGESMPRAKRASPPAPAAAPLPARDTTVYAGTTVARGRGLMLVTATGAATEVGAIARMAEEERPLTPLQQRLARLATLLLRAGVGICVLLTVVFLADGNGLASSLLLGVSLAVAAIPEGLSAVVTITLAIGMRRLAQRGAIVRRLIAVETLGSTSVICADKTGTLTRNEMTVTRLLPFRADRPHALAGCWVERCSHPILAPEVPKTPRSPRRVARAG